MMADLTDEQLSKAVHAVERKHRQYDQTSDVLRSATPYLQLPWDEPTEAEINLAYGRTVDVVGAVCRDISQMVVREFVRRRNAALLPKPVDPRRKKIADILGRHVPDGISVTVDRILDLFEESK